MEAESFLVAIGVVFLKAMHGNKQCVFDILRIVINSVLLYNSPRIFHASLKQLWKALTYCLMNLLRSSDEASVIKRDELTTSSPLYYKNASACLLLSPMKLRRFTVVEMG
jgi:hypothetical protein